MNGAKEERNTRMDEAQTEAERRAWFVGQVAELKAELEKLPPERQEQFRRELEEGKGQ